MQASIQEALRITTVGFWEDADKPLRNAILIPPKGEVFVAKYVTGYERNILIMSDKSNYGRKWVMNEELKPVLKAEGKLATNPTNPKFMSEYRLVLQVFLEKHRDGLESALSIFA
ncbi:hypothetical protein [Paenibacillus periandrae]|uniref:hypothetical protein n=1 Tax=Paenibacillus periandrae TaxID=1761741 RepID=UPI001F09B76D|nr:hypothetical protein [Paenibacillus periandrae]